MAKQTLLEVVQSALTSISGDDVNSINDTEEALQIARLARDLYYVFANTHEWPHLKKLRRLDSGGDVNRPSHLLIPEEVQEIEELRYESRGGVSEPLKYKELTYLYPDEFLNVVMSRDSTATAVDTITDFDNTPLLVYNNVPPTYWTSFDDEYVVCDAYDSALESSLQSSKTQAFVWEEPSFTLTDSHEMDLPAKEFPHFLAELKALVWSDVANTPNNKAEQAARRLGNWSAVHRFRSKGGVRFPMNYGRK